jgi:hypothetical protein
MGTSMTAAKPTLVGCLQRQGAPKDPTGYGGFVILTDWATLEPTQGRYDFSAVDAGLNTTLPSLRAKLRVTPPYPAWMLKALGSVAYTQPQQGINTTIPRVWDARFAALYAKLQAALAAKYDQDDRLAVVVATGPAGYYAEPFLLWNAASAGPLVVGGYTSALQSASMRACLTACGVWQHTPVAVALNPPNDKGLIGEPQATMALTRITLGVTAILENNSWRDGYGPSGADPYSKMYKAMAAAGAPLCLQTATMAAVGDLHAAMEGAIGLGVCSVELPAGHGLSAAEMTAYSKRLAANAPQAPTPPPPPNRRTGSSTRRIAADRRTTQRRKGSHRTGPADRRHA